MPLLAHLDVVNAACARIGADPLQSLDEDTFGGQQASLIYEPTIRFNLGIYPFGFSKQIRQLSIDDAATPLSGWTKVFDLPPEALGLPLYVTDDITDPDRRFSRYSLIGEQLQSDCSPLFAMIQFMPEPYLWSGPFLQASITGCASKFAMSIASDRGTADQLARDAYGGPGENYRGGELGAAIRADAYATPPRKADWSSNNPLVRAHGSGTHWLR